jgi:hypothetical protein
MAKALLDVAHGQLNRVALDEERSAAITELMAKEPQFYDTLFQNPGKGMTVNINFKSEDPETKPEARPAEYKPTLHVRFVSVTTSEPYELPEPGEGSSYVPGAAGADARFGWLGNTLTLTLRPVRPDPTKARKSEVIETKEALLQHMAAATFDPQNPPWRKVGGYLKRGAPVPAPPGSGVPGQVIEVMLFNTRLLVVEQVVKEMADGMNELAGKQLRADLAEANATLAYLQDKIDKAAGEGAVTRWWEERRFRIDPHLLDRPRAHLAAAENSWKAGDMKAADESLTACEGLLEMASSQLHAYNTGDLETASLTDPLSVRPGF